MAKRNPNRINELRLRRKWSQSELAEKVGAHWVTISKIERGQMQLTQDWMMRISRVLGVDPAELLSDPPTIRTLYLSGSLMDGGRVLSNEDQEFIKENDSLAFDVQVGANEPSRTVWFHVSTDAYYPLIQKGDLIRFMYQASLDIEISLGRLCFIEIEAEYPTQVVGIPSRGADRDTVDIQIYGGAPLKGVRVKDLAIASMAFFNPDFILDEDGYPMP